MVEITAAVVGVILAAFIGVKITGYRNLITYEITSISQKVAIEDNKVVAFEHSSEKYPTRITSYSLKLVNRGWKNIADVKLHVEGDFQPFSLEKTASTISVETITLGKKGNSLEISIGFLPAKEEVMVSFSSIESYSSLYKLTGAGPAYKVESIHYYNGSQRALSWVKFFLMCTALGTLGGIALAAVVKAVYTTDNTTVQRALTPNSANR